MAFPQIVAITCAESTDSVSTGIIDVPAGNFGDLLLAFINPASGPGHTITVPEGWTLIREYWRNEGATNGTERYRVVIGRTASTDASDTVEYSISGGTSRYVSQCYRISDWHGDVATGVEFSVRDDSAVAVAYATAPWGVDQNLWISGFMFGRTEQTFTDGADPSWSSPQVCRNLPDSSTSHLGALTAHKGVETDVLDTHTRNDFYTLSGSISYENHFNMVIRPGDSGSIEEDLGIRVTDIKEPNEADTLVTGVTNARVKVWIGTDDSGEEDDISSNQVIENGVLEVNVSDVEFALNDTVTVEVMWTVGTERKLFIKETTVVDLEGGT